MNCKHGDLAVVVRCPVAELNGRVLEIVAAYGNWPEYGFLWSVRSRTPWETWPDGREDLGARMRTDFEFPDEYLMPISGVPVNDEQRDEATA